MDPYHLDGYDARLSVSDRINRAIHRERRIAVSLNMVASGLKAGYGQSVINARIDQLIGDLLS